MRGISPHYQFKVRKSQCQIHQPQEPRSQIKKIVNANQPKQDFFFLSKMSILSYSVGTRINQTWTMQIQNQPMQNGIKLPKRNNSLGVWVPKLSPPNVVKSINRKSWKFQRKPEKSENANVYPFWN